MERAVALDAVAIAIDLGGTQYRVGAVTASGEVLFRSAYPTNVEAGPDGIIRDVAAAVTQARAALGARPCVGLGVAAAGPLDPATGTILHAPNLPGWRDVPLAQRLEAHTGLLVRVGNDANLAALAEARCGAGRGATNLVYLTVSTGVGSGFVVDGRLLLGEQGLAAEAGHMAIFLDGPLCGCGNRGCLEAYASGTGMANRAREALAAGRSSSLSSLGAQVTAAAIASAAEKGDQLAQELIAGAGRALGLGIRNLLHLLNPSVVVIGGGVSRIGPRLWDPMLQVVESDALEAYPRGVRIVPASLGDDSGLVGAGLLVYDRANVDL